MSSHHSSFSDFQSPTKIPGHSLGNQLGDFGFSSWKKQEIKSAQSLGENSNHDNSIIQDKTPKVFDNEAEQALQPDTQVFDDNEPAKQTSQLNEHSNIETDSNPKTLTLIEDELLSRQSANMSSRISQYNSEVDHETYASFLAILETNYEALIKGFQVLFQNMHNFFGQRIEKLESTYLSYFKIKFNQTRATRAQNSIYKQTPSYAKNQVVYMDCEVVSGEIKKILTSKQLLFQSFSLTIQQCYTKLRKIMLEVKGTIETKSKQIINMDNKIRSITEEMVDLMIPQNRKLKKKEIDPQVFQSGYVRTKYLMAKEKTFLNLIAEYLKRVIGFISFVCLQAEPKLNLVTKQILLLYVEALRAWKPEEAEKMTVHAENLSKVNSFTEIYTENIKIFELCTPESIMGPEIFMRIKESEKTVGEQIHKIIEYLIQESESLVYLPCIQVQSKDYVYHSRMKGSVFWRKMNNDKKQFEGQVEKSEEAAIIITADGYLIIQIIEEEEDTQKIALIKLSELKIGRKKDQIVLSYKGKGVIGYFLSSNAILGYLKFEPMDVSDQRMIESERNLLIDEFIGKIREVIQMNNEANNSRSKMNPLRLLSTQKEKENISKNDM